VSTAVEVPVQAWVWVDPDPVSNVLNVDVVVKVPEVCVTLD